MHTIYLQVQRRPNLDGKCQNFSPIVFIITNYSSLSKNNGKIRILCVDKYIALCVYVCIYTSGGISSSPRGEFVYMCVYILLGEFHQALGGNLCICVYIHKTLYAEFH